VEDQDPDGQPDMDQRDPKGVWPNLSRRSNEQQDNNKRIEFEIDQIKPS
jgi:hypothetical protein